MQHRVRSVAYGLLMVAWPGPASPEQGPMAHYWSANGSQVEIVTRDK